MLTPTIAARLIHESDELHACWVEYQEPESQALIAAVLLAQIPDGLERLRKAWIIDRLDAEQAAVFMPSRVSVQLSESN